MAQVRARRRRGKVLTLPMWLGVIGMVFVGGMALTNWPLVTAWAEGSDRGTSTFEFCGAIRRTCVVYGDTFWVSGEKIRIANIDAPETPGSERCEHVRYGKNPSWCDFELGLRARDTLREFLSSGPVEISRQGKDQYGRTLATVTVGGADAGEYLVKKGVARWWQR